ncbi:MAG: aspartate aminotransferase family protein, partial [Burkholderiales bacterium]|nr:aspartate aminotransferase family protein [Burkholderiales bacterium]
ERGLLINVTADRVIRLLPPLVMTQVEAQQLVDGLVPLVADFLAPSAAASAAR